MLEHDQFTIAKLNLLSLPRNNKPVCQLTGNRATVQLTSKNSKNTLYYASPLIAEQSWHAVMGKIVSELPSEPAKKSKLESIEERHISQRKFREQKIKLARFCMTEGLIHLSNRDYKFVIAAAIHASKFYGDVHGYQSINLIEPNLLLSKGYLGLNELGKAEETLALARWIFINFSDESNATKSCIHLLTGRLHSAKSDSMSAKSEYSKAIYYSSLCYGSESIETAAGYFLLGEIYFVDGNHENVLAYDEKVIEIWFKYLVSLRSTAGKRQARESGNQVEDERLLTCDCTCPQMSPKHTPLSSLEQLSEEIVADAWYYLVKVVENRCKILGLKHLATGEAQYTLGMFLFFLVHDDSAAEEQVKCAEKVYLEQLGDQSIGTKDVRSILSLIRGDPIVEVLSPVHVETSSSSSGFNNLTLDSSLAAAAEVILKIAERSESMTSDNCNEIHCLDPHQTHDVEVKTRLDNDRVSCLAQFTTAAKFITFSQADTLVSDWIKEVITETEFCGTQNSLLPVHV